MRIRDWSSDVCSSDLADGPEQEQGTEHPDHDFVQQGAIVFFAPEQTKKRGLARGLNAGAGVFQNLRVNQHSGTVRLRQAAHAARESLRFSGSRKYPKPRTVTILDPLGSIFLRRLCIRSEEQCVG